MPLDARIFDSLSGKALTFKTFGDISYLPVATLKSLPTVHMQEFLVDENYGEDLNVNASFGGSPEIIHTGEDVAGWTGSNLIGTNATFNSTGQAFSGTQSIYWNQPTVGDTIQFVKGSYLNILNYTALSLQIYIDSGWANNDNVTIQGYSTSAGTTVGNELDLGSYFNPTNFDIWQPVIIPVEDFVIGSEPIDTFRMVLRSNSGKRPVFYLDNIILEETGTLGSFEFGPEYEEVYELKKLIFSIADDISLSSTNGNALNLSRTQLMGATLTNGLALILKSHGVTIYSINIFDIEDLLAAGFVITNAIDDGSSSLITLELDFTDNPIHMHTKDGDQVTIALSDDLSTLQHFKVKAVYDKRIEDVD
jgi:hypothetical protein